MAQRRLIFHPSGNGHKSPISKEKNYTKYGQENQHVCFVFLSLFFFFWHDRRKNFVVCFCFFSRSSISIDDVCELIRPYMYGIVLCMCNGIEMTQKKKCFFLFVNYTLSDIRVLSSFTAKFLWRVVSDCVSRSPNLARSIH